MRLETGSGFVIFVLSLLFIAFALKYMKTTASNENIVTGLI